MIKAEKRDKFICDGCQKTFGKKKISYYCYPCDLDVCNKCYVIYLGEPVKNHKCELSLKDALDYDYECDICENTFEEGSLAFSCKKCQYDICHLCRFWVELD